MDEERGDWIKQQYEERRAATQLKREQEILEIANEKDRLWAPYQRDIENQNELNIAWKHELDIFHWERVVGFRELVALRITGHPLQLIPSKTFSTLPRLESLCLISCGLEALPADVC